MQHLHMCSSEQKYEEALAQFAIIYATNHKEMYDYIKKEWIDSQYCYWQIFRNKPGFANTNSNLESFNNTVRRIFTKRQLFYLSGSISKLAEIILYYSINKKAFRDNPKFYKNVSELASRLTIDNFKHTDRNTVRYKGKNNKFVIRLNDKGCFNSCSCSCDTFTKEAVCMHLLGYSNVHELNICGEEYSKEPDTFATKMKRGAPKKANRFGEINKK